MADAEINAKIKQHYDDTIRRCISQNYNMGKELGYLIIVGGEALNHYLSKDKQVKTSDYDLKFVVKPENTKDEQSLRKANALRLKIAQRLTDCIQKHPKPDLKHDLNGIDDIRIDLTMLDKNVTKRIETRGSYVWMIDVNNPSNKKRIVYKYNKIFTIKVFYTLNNQPMEYGMIDIGLYYKLLEGEPRYNFLTDDIYNTFLNAPFNYPIPMPYETEHGIRYPILKYILVDTFRMLLFVNDFFIVYKDDPEKQAFYTKKYNGYKRKLWSIFHLYKEKDVNEITGIARDIKKVVNEYEPLAQLNAICYRAVGKVFYVKEIQNWDECGTEYVAKLDAFQTTYNSLLHNINQLPF